MKLLRPSLGGISYLAVFDFPAARSKPQPAYYQHHTGRGQGPVAQAASLQWVQLDEGQSEPDQRQAGAQVSQEGAVAVAELSEQLSNRVG